MLTLYDTLLQELVKVFNFHKYDNLRHASHKVDPRRHRFETKGLNIVNLLFSAASGDVTSMRRHHLSGMDMSAFDYDGRSALHLAAAEVFAANKISSIHIFPPIMLMH